MHMYSFLNQVTLYHHYQNILQTHENTLLANQIFHKMAPSPQYMINTHINGENLNVNYSVLIFVIPMLPSVYQIEDQIFRI